MPLFAIINVILQCDNLKGYLNFVEEIQKIWKILKTAGFKAKIVGSKIVQVKGLMPKRRHHSRKRPPAEPLGKLSMA